MNENFLSHNEELLSIYITGWMYENQKLKEINHYLYEHTEFFERGYEIEFQGELHNFFAKKITRFTKDENLLRQLLPEKILTKVNKNLTKIMERNI